MTGGCHLHILWAEAAPSLERDRANFKWFSHELGAMMQDRMRGGGGPL